MCIRNRPNMDTITALTPTPTPRRTLGTSTFSMEGGGRGNTTSKYQRDHDGNRRRHLDTRISPLSQHIGLVKNGPVLIPKSYTDRGFFTSKSESRKGKKSNRNLKKRSSGLKMSPTPTRMIGRNRNIGRYDSYDSEDSYSYSSDSNSDLIESESSYDSDLESMSESDLSSSSEESNYVLYQDTR